MTPISDTAIGGHVSTVAWISSGVAGRPAPRARAAVDYGQPQDARDDPDDAGVKLHDRGCYCTRYAASSKTDPKSYS